MTTYDAAMVILLVLGMVRGAWRGFTWQVASLGSLILGYTSARTISTQVAPYLPGQPEVQRALAMVVVYIAVSGGIFALAWMVRGTLRKLKFDAYDRHLGMLLGGAEAGAVGLLATLFLVSMAPGTRQPIFESPTGKVVGTIMEHLGPILPEEVRKVLAPHWHGLASNESLADSAAPATGREEKVAEPVSTRESVPDALPPLQEPAAVADRAHAAIGEALPPLEPVPTQESRDAGLHRTRAGASPAPVTLDSTLAKGRQEIDRALAETLDTDPDAKAQSLRQLVQKKKQRINDAATDSLGKARQKAGQKAGRVQDQVSQRQQALERAISDSIAKGQERVEQAITDSIDQQLRRLGGLQPANAPRTGGK